ncbi:MAG: FAD-dependent oxidoreductase [Magnetococcales bacterium]|nr:FAD-dependent oxidoreductase [Magnetococcales bacterium]
MEVTLIGSGFAALAAIHRLRQLDPGRRIKITMVAPRAEFVYLPSLIWIPSGMRKGSDLRVDLQGFLDRMGVDFHAGSAREIQDGGRSVVTSTGVVANDALLIASGAEYLQKIPGVGHTLNPCSGIAAVDMVRRRIQTLERGVIAMGFGGNPHEPTAIRGGPMFEFLFGLHTQLRRERRRGAFKLVFFAPMAEPGKRMGPRAVGGLLKAMAKRNIYAHLGHKITAFEPQRVSTEGGDIPADLVLFLPGLTGPSWLAKTGLALSPGGFLQADAQGRVAGGERVYVAGDAGSFPGPEWRAKQGHMAELQARAAASNIYAELTGHAAQHTFRTELICIVDTLNQGMLVSRFKRFSLILPPTPLMHWVKEWLEWRALRPFRSFGKDTSLR